MILVQRALQSAQNSVGIPANAADIGPTVARKGVPSPKAAFVA